MNRKYYVYGYIRLDNNSYFYIGKGCGKRIYETKFSRGSHFIRILETKDVCVEILQSNLTEEEAYEHERDIIERLVFEEGYSISVKGMKRNQDQHLVNKSWGGDGNIGYKQSEFAKESLRKRMTGRTVSEETKKKLSNLNKGEKHPKFGTKHSDETRKRISESLKGKKFSKERLKNLSESHKGIPSPQRKKVKCIELNKVFDSISEANEYCKKYGYNRLKISECCNGKRKYSGKLKDGTKLHWQYYTPATTEYEDSRDREATV